MAWLCRSVSLPILAGTCLLGGSLSALAQGGSTIADCAKAALDLPSPSVDVRSFGARGDGVADDTAAIYAAIRGLPSGGTVFFPPGTYAHRDVLRITANGVTLAGSGATLYALNPDRGTIFLLGSKITLQDLRVLSADPGTRGLSPETSGIVVRGESNRVLRSSVSRSKSSGIWVSGGRNYEISCNTVFDTMADGIHSTDGAQGGIVRFNQITNSGDDGISVVSYNFKERASSILIEDNTVEQIRWGRGISVIGSTDVQIRRNSISKVAMAAGVIVAREASFGTPGAARVLISQNTISDVQQNIAPLPFAMRTGHGAIEINSDAAEPDLSISAVEILDNTVIGSAYDGVRLLGNVCDITIERNKLNGIAGIPIAIGSNCASPVHQCSGNTSDEQPAPCP